MLRLSLLYWGESIENGERPGSLNFDLSPFVPICPQVSLSKFWLQGDTVLVTLGKSIACSLYLARLSGKPCLLQALGPDAHSRKLMCLQGSKTHEHNLITENPKVCHVASTNILKNEPQTGWKSSRPTGIFMHLTSAVLAYSPWQQHKVS